MKRHPKYLSRGITCSYEGCPNLANQVVWIEDRNESLIVGYYCEEHVKVRLDELNIKSGNTSGI